MKSEDVETFETEKKGEATTNQDIQDFVNRHRFSNNSQSGKSKTSSERTVTANLARASESTSVDQETVDSLRKSINSARNAAILPLLKNGEEAVPVVRRTNYYNSQYNNAVSASMDQEDEPDEFFETDVEEDEGFDETDSPSEEEGDENESEDDDSGTGKSSQGKSKKNSSNKAKNNKKKSKVGKNSKKPQKPKVPKKTPQPLNAKKAANKLAKKALDTIMNIITKFPQYVILVVAIIILIIFIIAAIAVFSITGDSELSYNDPLYDINRSIVIITDPANDSIIYDKMLIEDFIQGATYAKFYNNTTNMTDEQKNTLYSAYMIYVKSYILDIGNYNYETKELVIKSGTNGVNYCDLYGGCKEYQSGSTIKYVPSSYTESVSGTVNKELPAATEEELNIIQTAHSLASDIILTDGKFEEKITTYDYTIPKLTEDDIDNWIKLIQENKSMVDVVLSQNNFKKYQTYSISEFLPKLRGVMSGGFWWPIGGSEVTEQDGVKFALGEPTAVTLTAYFAGNDSVHKGSHGAIDIAGHVGSGRAKVIASKGGTVIYPKNASQTAYGNGWYNRDTGMCCSDGGGLGNYVMIDHGDGTYTRYGHMEKNTITVYAGDYVQQGQVIGEMGTSGCSTGVHLHFDFFVGGKDKKNRVDPLDYVSYEGTSRMGAYSFQYEEGSDNKQTVCKSLIKSGLSENAVAAVMLNVNENSAFTIGDDVSANSYGIYNWNLSQKIRLKSRCSDEYNSLSCQMQFLFEDLEENHRNVFYSLRSDDTADNMAKIMCKNYDKLKDRPTTCDTRVDNGINTMLQYVQNGCSEGEQ